MFEYHRLENLAEIETQLKSQGLLTSVEIGTAGQVGQAHGFENLDPQLRGCAPVQQNKPWASSSVRIEHQPPKLGVEGSNPSPPASNNSALTTN